MTFAPGRAGQIKDGDAALDRDVQVDRRLALADLDGDTLADIAARARDALSGSRRTPEPPATQGVHTADLTRGKTGDLRTTASAMCVRPRLVAGSAPPAPLPRTTRVADVPAIPEGPGGSVARDGFFSLEGPRHEVAVPALTTPATAAATPAAAVGYWVGSSLTGHRTVQARLAWREAAVTL